MLPSELLENFPTLSEIQREKRRRRDEAERRRLAERADEIRDRCRSFMGFIREAWHVIEPTTDYAHSWHHDCLAEHLEAVTRGQIQRLEINQPPGTMKSLIASVLFEAWEWGAAGLPGMRYLTTSYKEGYARRDSRKNRDLVLSEWYRTLWPDVELIRENEANFENTYHGVRLAVPFKSLTAGRGNRLIIDDPHSTEQVESDTEIERATRIFRESATSRLNDPSTDAIIVIMHRLHPKDVCGVIEELGLPYVKVVIPMEYHRSLVVKTPFFEDPRTADGELLCPERIPRETVEKNKVELGEYAFQTQYQQQVRERSGTEFFVESDLLDEEGRPFDEPRTCAAVFAVIDSATKTGKDNDGTGVAFYAYENMQCARPLLILDWDYVQIEGDLLIDWLPTVFQRLEEFGRRCGARMGSLGAYVEDKASGMILLQAAQRRGMPAEAIDSKLTAVGKVERAISVSGYVRQKQVGICHEAHGRVTVYRGRARNHLIGQVVGFRIGGKDNQEDDLLDVFTYGIALSLGNAEGF